LTTKESIVSSSIFSGPPCSIEITQQHHVPLPPLLANCELTPLSFSISHDPGQAENTLCKILFHPQIIARSNMVQKNV